MTEAEMEVQRDSSNNFCSNFWAWRPVESWLREVAKIMNSKIKFSIKNLDELKKLLVLAEEQTKQLDETINKIKEFRLVAEFYKGKDY